MAFTNGFISKNFEVETASWCSYYLVTDNENHFELNWAFFYYHVETGLRRILQEKTILQSNLTTNDTDKIENKIK